MLMLIMIWREMMRMRGMFSLMMKYRREIGVDLLHWGPKLSCLRRRFGCFVFEKIADGEFEAIGGDAGYFGGRIVDCIYVNL